MARGLGKVVTGIITLIIGGTAYAVSQTDVIKNFSDETGMTKQEAQQYIENISEDELSSFTELGASHISEGQEVLDIASQIDCINYQYEWETETLSCEEGVTQFIEFGDSSVALGEKYKVLGSESASTWDIQAAINLIERLNESLTSEFMVSLLGDSNISEIIKTNLYNKALLQTALESD